MGTSATVPEQAIRVRSRQRADLDGCVLALAAVHKTGGYPSNWPDDPARWLTPAGMLEARRSGGQTAASRPAPLAGTCRAGCRAGACPRPCPAVTAAAQRGTASPSPESADGWRRGHGPSWPFQRADARASAEPAPARIALRLADLKRWPPPTKARSWSVANSSPRGRALTRLRRLPVHRLRLPSGPPAMPRRPTRARALHIVRPI
jgi:hypothetical protein